ncbi:MAG: hypothetical protein KC933_37840 [Myxococcales bacterium]|nr:hypothetical protein [Myxococcales bacterium]
MTDRDDQSASDPLLAAVSRAAREEAHEVEAWWAAAAKGDAAGLPADAPAPTELAPLTEVEQAAMTEALFGIPAAAPVVSLSSRRRRVSVAAGLALAAGIAAMVVISRPPTLPGYQLEVRAGEKALRSDGPSEVEPEYAEGSVLSFVLRPERRAEVPVAVVAVLHPEVGPPQVVPFEVELAEGGAVRLTAELGHTFSAPPGRYRLVFLLAPEGALPPRPAEGDAAVEGIQRLEHRFRVVADN